jgi:transposase
MVKDFLKRKLSPKLARMNEEKVIICMDKGLKLKPDEVKEAICEGGSQNIDSVWIFPTNTAKFVSPLDNTLWHSLKERVRSRKPGTEDETAEVLRDEFMKITDTEIHNYYKHCALTRGSDSYKDLD